MRQRGNRKNGEEQSTEARHGRASISHSARPYKRTRPKAAFSGKTPLGQKAKGGVALRALGTFFCLTTVLSNLVPKAPSALSCWAHNTRPVVQKSTPRNQPFQSVPRFEGLPPNHRSPYGAQIGVCCRDAKHPESHPNDHREKNGQCNHAN